MQQRNEIAENKATGDDTRKRKNAKRKKAAAGATVVNRPGRITRTRPHE